jgi:hypothetical protein
MDRGGLAEKKPRNDSQAIALNPSAKIMRAVPSSLDLEHEATKASCERALFIARSALDKLSRAEHSLWVSDGAFLRSMGRKVVECRVCRILWNEPISRKALSFRR